MVTIDVSKADESAIGFVVYATHQGYLVAFLFRIRLIDADGINPECSWPVSVTNLTKYVSEIGSDMYDFVITTNRLILHGCPPNI